MSTEKTIKSLLPILDIVELRATDIMNGNSHPLVECDEEGCLLCELRGATLGEVDANMVAQSLLEQYRSSEEMQEEIPNELIQQLIAAQDVP